MSICAIHQPNFFPWLGYFDKIKRADTFVFLDDVAYPKSGSGAGSWSNRVKMLISGKPSWCGCPIKRFSGIQKINTVEIDNSQLWKKKFLKSIMYNYSKTVNFQNIMPIITELVEYPTNNLCALNINAIKKISSLLGINTKFINSSSLEVKTASTQLLIDITKKINADSYLCGGGASSYQDDDKITTSGINLIYQNFKTNAYCEQNFEPGLSIIDYLMKSQSLTI
jgi:hypothetical protein